MNGSPIKSYDFIGDDLLHNLDSKGVIVKDTDGLTSVVYPVSALPTPHKVKLKDGRAFCSICAVDSLGRAFAFSQDITVTSSCSYSQKSISVAIENSELSAFDPGGIFVTHTDLVGDVNWTETC